MNRKTQIATRIGDLVTYGLLGAAVALCAVGAFYAHPDVAPMVVSVLAGAGFLGLLVALIVVRARFRATYNYWTDPKTGGVGFRGRPCWDREKAEVALEAVIRFWETKYPWDQIIRAIEGLTVYVRPDPWSYLGRLVVGLANRSSIAVKYEKDITKSAFAHEVSHVIIGNIDGQWDEQLSHRLMDNAGLSRDAIGALAEEIRAEDRLVDEVEGRG